MSKKALISLYSDFLLFTDIDDEYIHSMKKLFFKKLILLILKPDIDGYVNNFRIWIEKSLHLQRVVAVWFSSQMITAFRPELDNIDLEEQL